MNKDRRTRIRALITQLESINSEIADILSEEQDAFDNMPEGLQEGERGDKAQEAISNLEAASLDDVISSLESATE
jgi:hypothetical protein